ncbi:hypothetical protein [Nonomuraea sp. NPDC049725]
MPGSSRSQASWMSSAPSRGGSAATLGSAVHLDDLGRDVARTG